MLKSWVSQMHYVSNCRLFTAKNLYRFMKVGVFKLKHMSYAYLVQGHPSLQQGWWSLKDEL